MLVSYNWLKSLLPTLTATPAELAEKMSTSGIEVEGVTSPADGLTKLVVGEVLEATPIPDTHLWVCKVNVGAASERPLQIVCGAPNVRAGVKAITALVGARIGGGTKIKKGKIRGVESEGMLCALDEIGIPANVNPMKHEEGIYLFGPDAVPGKPVFPYLGLDDHIIDLSITPNRADALSMRGVAYEVAAIYDLSLTLDHPSLTEIAAGTADKLSVRVETEKVPTYKIRLIENVTIVPSPAWLQNRLMNSGIRPINNVVDITNYILLYYGQPLHAFDFDKFGSNEILIRQAETAEKMTTLDGEARALTLDDIVITADGQPVALGGVMGGLDSEITSTTTTVALEAALFNGTSIRRTSQRFNLRSEASSRFEKGINEGTVREALDAAAAMIVELAGGQVLSGVVESNDYQPAPVSVSITLDKINQALGTNLINSEVSKIFKQLGFGLAEETDTFTVSIPSRRWDIAIEADLVEEVARIYGYDRLPSTLPAGATAGELTAMQRLRRKVRSRLEAVGLSEVVAYSLVSAEKAVEFLPAGFPTTSLLLPMTEDHQTLRVNLIPGLLGIIRYNQNRKSPNIAIYEIGTVFLPSTADDGRPTELPNLAFAISGAVAPKTYQQAAQPVDFYYAKGIVENLLEGYEGVRFVATADIDAVHPGRTAQVLIGERPIGFVGQLHPKLAAQYGITETYVAGLDLQALLDLQPAQTIFKEIPKFPAVSRDIALLVDSSHTHAEILEVIQASKVKALIKTELFDLYDGDKLPAGKKSLAYSLTFQNPTATMTDEEINKSVDKIVKNLVEKLQVEIR